MNTCCSLKKPLISNSNLKAHYWWQVGLILFEFHSSSLKFQYWKRDAGVETLARDGIVPVKIAASTQHSLVVFAVMQSIYTPDVLKLADSIIRRPKSQSNKLSKSGETSLSPLRGSRRLSICSSVCLGAQRRNQENEKQCFTGCYRAISSFLKRFV